MSDDNVLYCVIGTGRSGSSLLAAILAGSGGNFGMPAREDWDPVKGAMEHPACHASYKYLNRINRLHASPLPDALFGMGYLEKRFRATLSELRAFDFAKSSTLVWLVPHLDKVGLAPRVIVSFRRFHPYALSRHSKYGWSYKTLEDAYVDVYRTAWLQLNRYGGVIVDFDDLCRGDSAEWSEATARLTGLRAEELNACRGRLAKASGAKLAPGEDLAPAVIRDTEKLFLEHKDRMFEGRS